VQCFVKVLKSLAWASRVSWVVEDFNSTRKALFHSTNFGEGIDLEEVFTRELAQAARGGYPLSIVIIDMDHLKEHNDSYGHPHGDNLLRTLGEILRTQFRAGDIACRYGGDEFIIIMPHSVLEDTFQRIELLRQAYQSLHRDQNDGIPKVTFSAGIATYPTHAKTTEELLRIADQALYNAKSLGRNRTCSP
jgi:diguanylate cyclase (GGDEF)-like protein